MNIEELVRGLKIKIAELQIEYDEHKAGSQGKGNPYIVGIGSRLMTFKEVLDVLEGKEKLPF